MPIQSKHSLPAHGQIYRPDQPPHATKDPTLTYHLLQHHGTVPLDFFGRRNRHLLQPLVPELPQISEEHQEHEFHTLLCHHEHALHKEALRDLRADSLEEG